MNFFHISPKKVKLIVGFMLCFILVMNFFNVALANVAKSSSHFNDTIPEARISVNDNQLLDMRNLRVTYSMGEGICLIRGVNYSYNNVPSGSGPHSVGIEFEGDSYLANYLDTGIPHVTNDTFRAFYCDGPTYLLDDAPAVNFIGTQRSDTCIQICADDPSTGNSYYDTGSGWTLEPLYEYIVEILYENISDLNFTDTKSGDITATDNIDAYYVNLNESTSYVFILDRTGGAGNLTMRLVANQEITNATLSSSVGTGDSVFLSYRPSSNGTFVLLVEAEDAFLDTASYNVTSKYDGAPSANQPENISTSRQESHTIDWYLYDDYHGGYYQVFVNSTPSDWLVWQNNTNLHHPINRDAPGFTNYTIIYNDTAGNWGVPSTVWVTVRDEQPSVSYRPADLIVDVNSTRVIPWVLIDDFGAGDYRVFDNTSGVLTPSGWEPWVNDTSVDYPVNSSNLGTFEYIIQFRDSIGQSGTSTDAVIVTVIEDDVPFANQPDNISVGVNASVTIDWVLTDAEGAGFYQVLVNGTPGDPSAWINGSSVNFPVNTSAGGIYNHTIQYNDSIGQYGIPSTVFVTVIADFPPTSNQPNNVTTYRNGTETIDWVIYDDKINGTYRVFVNSSPGDWYSWENNTNLHVAIDRSAPGFFNYTLTYNDTGENWGEPSTVWVTILDSAPSVNHPSNQTVDLDSSQSIPWIIVDDYGTGYYRVLDNTTGILTPNAWQPWINNSSVDFPVNTSNLGVYEYIIEYNDSVGLLGAQDSVFVTVFDDAPPASNHPENITVDVNDSVTIDWVLTDGIGAGFYRVLVNGTPGNWSAWINGSSLNIPVNTTVAGTFIYEIQYNDSLGQFGTPDTVFVFVILDYPPYSNHPNNITTYRNGAETIDWILYDNFGGSYYQVLVNSSPSDWMSWENETNLHYPIDRSAPGIYNYTILYNDTYNLWGPPDTVFITIIDTAPSVNQPSNVTTERQGTETIDWTLIDDYGSGDYQVLVNSTPSSWLPWSNSTNLQYPINRTLPGVYNYTIRYNDSAGQLGAKSTVWVTVLDNVPTSNDPAGIAAAKDELITIAWVLTDDYGAGYYQVLVNSSPDPWETWTNGSAINYPVETSMTGVYNYTISYNDSVGQWGNPHTVIVVVSEYREPLATSEIEVNLTGVLDGVCVGDEDAFSMYVHGWNGTSVNATISNVSLYNHYFALEEAGPESAPVDTQTWAMAFNVTDSCQLVSVDFLYSTPTFPLFVDVPWVGVTIYNAKFDAGQIKPDQVVFWGNESGLIYTGGLAGWVSASVGGYWDGTFSTRPTLDIQNTYQKCFFISFNTSGQTLNWRYNLDSVNGDQGDAYQWLGGFWLQWAYDLTLRLTLAPLTSTIQPHMINMTINSELVSDLGRWEDSSFRVSDPSGFILMDVTSTWYSISYTVNWTVILENITTTSTYVYASPLNETVEWDIILPAEFIPSSYNNTISIDIPLTWNTTVIYKGISKYFNWVEISSNPKKTVLIHGATDGLWTILSEGYNWITNVTVNKALIYTLDEIYVLGHLRASVQDPIDTALLNITDAVNNTLATFSGRGIGTEINISVDISQILYTNGKIYLTMEWCNGTEAGIATASFDVYNATSLTIAYPHHIFNVIERSRGSLFNLILYYNMSEWSDDWDTVYLDSSMGATVTYKYMGLGPEPMSVIEWEGHSAWSIPLEAPGTVGDYPVHINATAWGGVQNYTDFIIIIRVAQFESKLVFNDTAKESFWNTAIGFTFRYTNITDYPIIAENILIDWKYASDAVWQGTLVEGLNYTVNYNGGTGVYTIVFANFTAHVFNLLFTIDGESYQPQEEYLTLIFANRTTVLTEQTVIPRILYQQTGSVVVTLYYEDVVNNSGIQDGAIWSNWSLIQGYSIQPLGMGYYNITLDVPGVPVGNYSILITASKTHFETASLVIHLEIYGYPSSIGELVGANLVGDYTIIYAMENWAITFEYLNASNSAGIANASVSAMFGGYACIWQEIGGGNYTVWADSTVLPAPMAGQNYTLDIAISKTFYEDQSFSITIIITQLPTVLTPLETMVNAEVNDYVQIEVQLNDTHNLCGVNGIIWYELQGDTSQMVPGAFKGHYYAILNLTNYIPNTYIIQIWSWGVDYTNASTAITLKVELVNYSLTLRVPTHVNNGQNLTIQADLFNGTHYIGSSVINFAITIVLQNDTIRTYYLSSLTLSNGTASVIFLVPNKVISLYIVASYQRDGRDVVDSDTGIVTAVDPFLFFLESSFFLIIILLLIGYFVIFAVYVYRRKLRPKFMSVESKKRDLMKRRAENRREIATITQEIMQYRAETLKEADLAKKNMEYSKAAKLYEKAGNLTLELADKSVAREFFLKAKDMQKHATDKEREKDLRVQRDKLLDKARAAIRDRDVVEASRNYREVAEISRRLGEREQAAKFLKLANAAHERIESLREGDLRKKSGAFLSKADKAMGKQDYMDAAENFEEAAKIMVTLGEDDGVERFAGWAKLAREREALSSDKSREEWIQELNEKQKLLVAKARALVREKKYHPAIDTYTTLIVYAVELGDSERIEKYKKNMEYCRNQAYATEISPETRSLMNERKKLLVKVEDAIKGERFAVAARYYSRIASISEVVDGKEVARTYQKQAKYYKNMADEKKAAERERLEEREKEMRRPPPKATVKLSVDEIEKTQSELAMTVKNARHALKTDKNVLARELYDKASKLSALLKDKDSEVRYKQKAEEIEILKPGKPIENEGEIRRQIADLMQKAEKAIQKKKYNDAKENFEEISELFIQLGEEDAADEFLERANAVSRLIKR